MDQSNSSNTGSSPENTDLAKQYQDILDRYSEELAAQPPPPETVVNSPPKNIPAPQPDMAPGSSPSEYVSPQPQEPITTPLPPETQSSIQPDLAESQDIPLTEVPPPEPAPLTPANEPAPPVFSPNPIEVIPPPPAVPLVNSPMNDGPGIISTPKKSGGFFKFLFFVSLLIFLGVFGTIAYNVFFANSSNNQNTLPPENSENTPTPPTAGVCELNDQKYAVGDSFAAADGCNTCSCGPDLTIICTEKACDATPSTKVTPTKTATTSAVKAGYPIKNIVDAINTLLKTKYNPVADSTKNNGWKVDLTQTSTKTDITAVKSVITTTGSMVLQPELSGEGVDWKEVYTKSADTCELEMAKSVLTLICHQ
jgi:hypothetical protein